ncbi:MAG: Xaa-Pro dipeptidase, partial [Verrucomicrobia bacterium]
MNFKRFFSLIGIASVISAASAIGADQIIALKAARLFDGKSRALIQNGVVLVQGDKIVDAGANVAVPPDAQVIDLGDATLS